MKLVDLYKREYEPKYQYPDNWHLSISPTDRHTFSIENKILHTNAANNYLEK